MSLFDFFKSKETLEQERYEREAREKHEAEEKQKREWDSLSEEEKGRRVKKEQDDFNSAARERREIEAIWFKRGVSVLKNRPGECFTVKRILDALPANDDEHSYYYRLFNYYNSDLYKEGIGSFTENNTVFFVYNKQR